MLKQTRPVPGLRQRQCRGQCCRTKSNKSHGYGWSDHGSGLAKPVARWSLHASRDTTRARDRLRRYRSLQQVGSSRASIARNRPRPPISCPRMRDHCGPDRRNESGIKTARIGVELITLRGRNRCCRIAGLLVLYEKPDKMAAGDLSLKFIVNFM